eukprot:TRINITY_DN39792_c0_g1_i1.p1 TRINITY_DN39792_c0_g1~~TRINITY_DN39792_c0_g1_i1.p1  ORF type:complete len:336 (-),score=51.54 TRINITY_DN39792_c0_g1_i1:198-1094(-)
MPMALKRCPSPGASDAQEIWKRRRLSVAEVEAELERAGLMQPALKVLCCGHRAVSDVEDVRVGEGCMVTSTSPLPQPLKRCAAWADGEPEETAKRRRPGPLAESPQRPMVEANAALERIGLALSSGVVPVLNCSNALPLLPRPLMRPAIGPPSIMVDPRGTAFVYSDQGFLLAELPSCLRPRVVLADDRGVAEIAKVALDPKGTAYLFSEDGALLMVVPAVCAAHDLAGLAEQLGIPSSDVEIQMLGCGGCKQPEGQRCLSMRALSTPEPCWSLPTAPAPTLAVVNQGASEAMEWEAV